MNPDDIFKYGFRNFVTVTVTVSAVCIIIWLSIEKKVEKFNRTYPDRAVSKAFISSPMRNGLWIASRKPAM